MTARPLLVNRYLQSLRTAHGRLRSARITERQAVGRTLALIKANLFIVQLDVCSHSADNLSTSSNVLCRPVFSRQRHFLRNGMWYRRVFRQSLRQRSHIDRVGLFNGSASNGRSNRQLHCINAGKHSFLPCRSRSIDGIWNLGVMEHFSESQLIDCLLEFRRVLKPGGTIILFWPPEGNASRWVLGPLERLIRWFSKKPFTFFPNEISRLRSKDQARRLLERNGFKVLAVEFSWRTAFIHMVVVGKCA